MKVWCYEANQSHLYKKRGECLINSFDSQKLDFLQSIGRLIKAIDDSTDWFILYIKERDKNQKKFFYSVYLNKCKQEKRIAKEEREKYGKK